MVIIPRTPEEAVSSWLAVLACAIRNMGATERERARMALDYHAAAFLCRDDAVTADVANAAIDRLITCLTVMLPEGERGRFLAGRDADGLSEFRALANALLADGGEA